MTCDGCTDCVCDELRLEIARLREALAEHERIMATPILSSTE